jgi:hypothetical protein
MNKSDSITELAKALVKFHSQMGKVSKDAKNPFYKNSYASLSNIIEASSKPLNDNGLSIVQMPCNDGLTTMLVHESGEWISSTSSTPVKDETDPQKLGSAITYARRYALGAILSLNIDEDDDGQKASTVHEPTPMKRPITGSEQKTNWLNPNTPQWTKAVDFLIAGGVMSDIKKKYAISKDNEQKLMDEVLEKA